MITIDIHNAQSQLSLDQQRLRDAVRMILQGESLSRAEISIAVVDDPAICELHRKYLQRDEPTDVLSFLLERSPQHLEGEVIVSAQTAVAAAPGFHWLAEDELLLYVIHGTLHLVGYDDGTPRQRAEMRRQERACLARFGLEARYAESGELGSESDSPRQDSPAQGEKQR